MTPATDDAPGTSRDAACHGREAPSRTRPSRRPRRRAHGRSGRVARPAAAPATNDRLASSCRSSCSSCRSGLPGFQLDQLPGLILRAEPAALLLAAFAVFYPGSRSAACAGRSCCAGPGSTSASATRPRSSSCRWLVNCLVPAKLGDIYRAYLLKINSPVSLSADVRDGVHRADPRPVRDRAARACRGLRQLPAGLPPAVQVVFASASWSSWCSRPGSSRCATSAGASSSRLPLPRADPGVVRPVRGGRLLGGRAAGAAPPRRADRPDLGDRGDAPLPRRRGARLPRRPPRDQRRVLRRAHGLAADGGAADARPASASSRPASWAC